MSTIKAILGTLAAVMLVAAGFFWRKRRPPAGAVDGTEAEARAERRQQVIADLAAAREAEKEKIANECARDGGLAGYLNRRK